MKTPVTARLKAAINLLLLPCGIFVLWQTLSALRLVNPYLIPSPSKVARAFTGLFASGELFRHARISLFRVWAGYAIAGTAALPAAFLCYRSVFFRRFFHGVFEFLRAIPPLAMIPLLILWAGLGEASKLAVIVLASFFPVFLNAFEGFASMDGRWAELSASLELSAWRHLRYVLVPSAAPQIYTGLKIAFGYAWRALLGAELFAAASGLGYLITDAKEMARIDVVFAGLITIGAMGIAFDALFRIAARKILVNSDERNWNAAG